MAIGEALLDQRNLAGIGNMYKCEALFVDTGRSVDADRRRRDLDAVVVTAHRFLRANRDHPEQSTTGRTGRGQEHWVYGRARRTMPALPHSDPLAEQGAQPYQRPTYWCPRCQPRRDCQAEAATSAVAGTSGSAATSTARSAAMRPDGPG